MEIRESKTLAVNDNSLLAQFNAALTNRPDWALSFTSAMTGARLDVYQVRVTYSDSERFGVSLQEAMNYIDRH